jgi:hypothetical protein
MKCEVLSHANLMCTLPCLVYTYDIINNEQVVIVPVVTKKVGFNELDPFVKEVYIYTLLYTLLYTIYGISYYTHHCY